MIEMKMRKLLYLVLGASCLLSACTDAEKPKSDLRAPAYPLVTIDPYTSAWSTTDNLYDSPVKHWTGKNHPLIGVVRVERVIVLWEKKICPCIPLWIWLP